LTRDKAESLCAELDELASCRPGQNDPALSKVRGILGLLRDQPQLDVRGKATDLEEYFKVWFSPRRWRRQGELRAMQALKAAIYELKSAVQTRLK
jgi:hypothetical protein